MILQNSQLCEQMETMVSFLVLTDSMFGPERITRAKACSLAFACPVTGVQSAGARKVYSGVVEDFTASASFPTHFRRCLSLVRLHLSSTTVRSDGEVALLRFETASNSHVTSKVAG
jgi:hypothetical protein